jgi:hypothetical protein
MFAEVFAAKADGPFAAQGLGTVHRARLRAVAANVVAFAHHEEGSALMQSPQAAQRST